MKWLYIGLMLIAGLIALVTPYSYDVTQTIKVWGVSTLFVGGIYSGLWFLYRNKTPRTDYIFDEYDKLKKEGAI